MRTWSVAGGIALVLLTLAPAAPARAASPATSAARITFRFAPPPGTRFIETLTTNTEKRFAGLGQQADHRVTRAAIAMRREGDGYALAETTLSVVFERDGKRVPDPIGELMVKLPFTYHFTRAGRITRIDGFAAVAARLKAQLPAEVAERLAPHLSEAALVAKETAEWNGRVGDFVGKSVAIGDSVRTQVPYTLPDGQAIQYAMVTRFAALVPGRAGRCVRIETRYDADAQALDRTLSGLSAGVAKASGQDSIGMGVSGSAISGSATRVLDPATMLIERETSVRTIRMTADVPGQGPVQVESREERVYTYEYR